MIKQVTKDVTDKPICASSVERLPAPSTRIVHTYLQAREGRRGIYREREDIIHQSMSSTKRQLITVTEGSMEPFTSVSRSASVTHIMSMDASDSSSWSSSKIESEGTASIATNGLRLSILGFAASTLCQCLDPQRNVVRIAYISDGPNRIDKREADI